MDMKIIGLNYLHRHPQMERSLNIDSAHIITDRNDWEEVVNYFRQHPEQMGKVNPPMSDIVKYENDDAGQPEGND